MEAKIVENVARNEVILNNCAEILDKKEINMRINENEHTIEISLKNMFTGEQKTLSIEEAIKEVTGK